MKHALHFVSFHKVLKAYCFLQNVAPGLQFLVQVSKELQNQAHYSQFNI